MSINHHPNEPHENKFIAQHIFLKNKTIMKYRLYDEGTDAQLFVTTDNGTRTIEENDFVFTGFGNGIHPYHKKETEWAIKMLLSKGIVLNLVEVSTVYQMSNNIDSGEITMGNITLPKTEIKKSSDGNEYILFQDTEMGRGWACLIKNKEILEQDHRDNIRNEILHGDLIRSFGIDYEKETVSSLKKIKR